MHVHCSILRTHMCSISSSRFPRVGVLNSILSNEELKSFVANNADHSINVQSLPGDDTSACAQQSTP